MTQIVNPIVAKVEEGIMNHDAFKGNLEIKVLEKGGVVTLRGKVPSNSYLQLAESIANGIEGVSSVINEIEIDLSMEEEDGLLGLEDESQVPPARSGPHSKG